MFYSLTHQVITIKHYIQSTFDELKYFLTVIKLGCWNLLHVVHRLRAFMLHRSFDRSKDKINGVTRELISTVNKALLTTRGNNLL